MTSLFFTSCEGTKVNFEATVIVQRNSTAVTGDADYKVRSPQTTTTPPTTK